MNVVGRPMARSNSAMHHQRQYSDNFMDASSKWLQSSSLSQVLIFDYILQICPSLSSQLLNQSFLRMKSSHSLRFWLQDFELYGSKTSRYNQRSVSERSPDASIASRSSTTRRNGDDRVSPSELSPGLLDLHSFDTELLPEVCPVTFKSCTLFFLLIRNFAKFHVYLFYIDLETEM